MTRNGLFQAFMGTSSRKSENPGEQARIQKELEERRRKVEKEQAHYQTAYEKITAQLLAHPDDAGLLSRKEEMEHTLSDISKALNDIDYRQT